MMKLLMFGVCGSLLLLAGCAVGKRSSQPSPSPARVRTGTAGVAADFTGGLSGRWHNNDFQRAGATKQFTPDQPGAQFGRAEGFWPLGGNYRITAADRTTRSMDLEVKSNLADGDQPAQSFQAKVVLSANGRQLRFETVAGIGGPEAPLTFYRVP